MIAQMHVRNQGLVSAQHIHFVRIKRRHPDNDIALENFFALFNNHSTSLTVLLVGVAGCLAGIFFNVNFVTVRDQQFNGFGGQWNPVFYFGEIGRNANGNFLAAAANFKHFFFGEK